MAKAIETVRKMHISAWQDTVNDNEHSEESNEVIREVATRMMESEKLIGSVKTGLETREACESDLAKTLRTKLLEEFCDSSLSGKYLPNPKVRGPFGEAEIWLQENARPISVPPYQLSGERREALKELVVKAQEMGKLEDGKGPWNTPAFPVPKKTTGKYRLVQDLRPQNSATIKDGHPLPRISEVVQRQGKKTECEQQWTWRMDVTKCH